MASQIANMSNDECLHLLQQLNSDDPSGILAAIEWFASRPGSFDEMAAKINTISEKQFYGCDFRDAVNKLIRQKK